MKFDEVSVVDAMEGEGQSLQVGEIIVTEGPNEIESAPP